MCIKHIYFYDTGFMYIYMYMYMYVAFMTLESNIYIPVSTCLSLSLVTRSGQFYYMFGFVLLAFIILVVVCLETSILLCYFHLCSEDYRWWWRSFFSTATTGFYLFLFSLHYFFFKTQIVGSLSYLVYFGYTFIIVFLFSIFTG